VHKGYEDKEHCIKDMRIKTTAQRMRVKNAAHRITGEEHFKPNKG
jgi:predicted transposase YbfD/YdcC